MTIFTECNDALNLYRSWPAPTAIISDGAYGLKGFPGDPISHKHLPAWYENHLIAWGRYATAQTTLWFWNTEVGWATMHPYIEQAGWIYRGCNIWNKGIAHIAGNSNTQTMRKFPVVSEVCVQYVREPVFTVNGHQANAQEWLRAEWKRTGLTWNKANEACGVRNAATRKYLTADHLWYFPPGIVFERLSEYANRCGDPAGKPYFVVDGKVIDKASTWEQVRGKFHCPVGVTNVWNEPALRSSERIKIGNKAIHLNQKPISLMKRIIAASTDINDTIWEPFGGLYSASLAASEMSRAARACEIDPVIHEMGHKRLSESIEWEANREQS